MENLSNSDVSKLLESDIGIIFSIKEIIVMDTMCSRIAMNAEQDSEIMTLIKFVHSKVGHLLDLQKTMKRNMNLNKEEQQL